MIEIYITPLTHIIILIYFFNFFMFRFFNAKHDQTSFPYKYLKMMIIVVVQLVNLCPAFCNPMDCSTPGFFSSFLLCSQNDLKELLSKLFTSEFSTIPGDVSRNLAVNPPSLKGHRTCLG